MAAAVNPVGRFVNRSDQSALKPPVSLFRGLVSGLLDGAQWIKAQWVKAHWIKAHWIMPTR
jgi:hypothetical protein